MLVTELGRICIDIYLDLKLMLIDLYIIIAYTVLCVDNRMFIGSASKQYPLLNLRVLL